MHPLRGLTPLCILLLAQVPLLSGGAVEAVHTWETDPLRVGDQARYQGRFNVTFTVEAPGATFDKSGRSATTFPLRAEALEGGVSIHHISVASMLHESAGSPCPVRSQGACTPWRLVNWGIAGVPGLFGATLLQGRTVWIGGSWEVDADCGICLAPYNVTIQPPTPHSPPGTAYVANITIAFSVPLGFTSEVAERLHMGASPFPLLVELPASAGARREYRLVDVTRGDTPIVTPHPPITPTYANPFAMHPFVDRRPPEGTPRQGFPTWRDVLEATGPDDLDKRTDALFQRLSIHVFDEGARVLDQRVGTHRLHHLASEILLPNGTVHTVDYTAFESELAKLLRPGQPLVWDARDRYQPSAQPAAPACLGGAPAAWDVVAHVEALRLFTGPITGFDIASSPLSPVCQQYRLAVDGPRQSHDHPPVEAGFTGFASIERVEIDAVTGHLTVAWLWEEPWETPL